jgi:hypothetical protein
LLLGRTEVKEFTSNNCKDTVLIGKFEDGEGGILTYKKPNNNQPMQKYHSVGTLKFKYEMKPKSSSLEIQKTISRGTVHLNNQSLRI